MLADKKLRFLFPVIITTVIFLSVLMWKGIFPFGTGRIDYYDMGQTNVPLYYHIWDSFHGKSSLFFDFFINGGQNLSMGSAIQWNISPFNLFFLFIPRNLVLKSLSIYMLLHLAAMSGTMFFFLDRVLKKAAYSWKVIFSVCYGLCGFTLTHYTIPTYLDTAVFFPLLALSLYRLLKYGKPYFYGVMLGFTIALSYYLGFMHLIYILLFSGVWILFEIPKEEMELRRDRSWKLGIFTVLGLMLSAIMLLPAVMQMGLSSRFQSNAENSGIRSLVNILNSIGADEYYVKYWQLFALEAAIIIIAAGFIKKRKDFKRNITVFSLCFIPCALIPFESINILWHLGTYYHYPIRCGYLIPFSILTAAAYFAGELWWDVRADSFGESEKSEKPWRLITGDDRKEAPKKRGQWWLMLLSIITAALLFVIVMNIYLSHGIWDVKELFRKWVLYAVLFAVFYTLVLWITGGHKGGSLYAKLLSRRSTSKEKEAGVSRRSTEEWKQGRTFFFICCPFIISELLLGAIIGYGNPRFRDTFFGDPEQSGEYAETAMELMDALPLSYGDKEDRLKKIKNPDTDLNTNYGMVLRRSSITGWANTLTRSQQAAAEKLGYSTHFMRILDSGGTAFSDSLLGVTDILTRVPFEGRNPLYEKVAEAKTSNGSYILCRNTAAFPFGVMAKSDIKDIDINSLSIVELNNALYHAIGGKQDIAEDYGKYADMKEDSGNINTKSDDSIQDGPAVSYRRINIKGMRALYLTGGKAEEILVNGEAVPVPTIGSPDNKAFPAWFNSNALYLGSFKDEAIEVSCPAASRLFSVDLDLLKEMSGFLLQRQRIYRVGPDYLFVEVSKSNAYMDLVLLPIHCDPGFEITLNGKKVEPVDVMGLFTGIPTEAWENSIKLVFTPSGFMVGLYISFATALILMIFMVRAAFSEGASQKEGAFTHVEKRADFGGRSQGITENAEKTGLIKRLSYGVFLIIFSGAALFIYIVPIIWFFIHQVLKRLPF